MRAIMYGIINKENGNIVFKSMSLKECTAKLKELDNNEGYAIAHKWYSI